MLFCFACFCPFVETNTNGKFTSFSHSDGAVKIGTFGNSKTRTTSDPYRYSAAHGTNRVPHPQTGRNAVRRFPANIERMDKNRTGAGLPHCLPRALQTRGTGNLLNTNQNTEGCVMGTFNLPKCSKVLYQLQPGGVYFVQTGIEVQETPVNRLPAELRLAPTGAAQIKPNADKMLLDRPVNNKHRFRTGIQPTHYNGWWLGNDFEWQGGAKVISLMLFHFTGNDTAIEVYYFHRYDKPNTFQRMQFAHAVIPHLTKKLAA